MSRQLEICENLWCCANFCASPKGVEVARMLGGGVQVLLPAKDEILHVATAAAYAAHIHKDLAWLCSVSFREFLRFFFFWKPLSALPLSLQLLCNHTNAQFVAKNTQTDTKTRHSQVELTADNDLLIHRHLRASKHESFLLTLATQQQQQLQGPANQPGNLDDR